MKDFDNIEDWYRDELNKFNVEPDSNVWNSLSDDLDADMTLTDDNISEWYKREVNKLEERPDYTVWEKLATKLDTASVWDKLVVSLNRYEQFIWWRNVIIRGSAILLLLGGSYVAYNNYFGEKENITSDYSEASTKKRQASSANYSLNNLTNNTPITSDVIVNEENNTSPHNHLTANNKSSNNRNKNNSVTQSINEAKNSVNPNTNQHNLSNITTYASLNSTPREIYFNSIVLDNLNNLKTKEQSELVEINRRSITEKDISHIYENADFLVKKEKNKIVFNSKRFSSYFTYGLYARRFYFGANAGLKKQGLITNIKKDGPLAQYTQTDYLDFGNNFGITAGYILSDKINIETNLNVNSTSGYKRTFNSKESGSFDEKLNLNYTTINVLAKKVNTKSTFDNKVYSTNLIGGVYASLLRTSSNDINGNTVDLDNFNATDMGIVLGIEQDRYITKTFIITPGIRYNQGLTSIANEDNAFKSARNFSLEFNLGIKYILLKKSK